MNKLKTYLSNLYDDIHLFELLKGASSTLIIKMLGLIVGYGFAIYITNQYGAYVFGQYVTALLVVEILSIVSRLGIDTSLVRFVSKYAQKGAVNLINQLYFKSVAIVTFAAIFFTLLLVFFSVEIAEFMNLEREYLVIVSFSFIPLVLFYMNVQAIRGLKKMVSYSFLNNVAITFGVFLFLVLFSVFTASEVLPIYAYVSSVIILTMLSYFLWFNHKSKVSVVNSDDDMPLSTNELLTTSFPLLLGQSMMIIMGKVDLFMLANMSSSDQVGIYNIALKLSMLSYMGLMAINSIAAPKFSEIYSSGDLDALKKIVQQSTKTIFWISLPVLTLLILFPEFILSMFGEEFKIASFTLIILSVGKMVSAISGSVGTFLQMVGKQKVFQNILIFAAVVNIVLNYFLIPSHGIGGAAIASATSGILWNVLMIIYIKRNFGFYTIYIPWIK
ncbi:flippase [Flavobacteriales bacterium]|nr:flippase [Flavobacteriales bacterium]